MKKNKFVTSTIILIIGGFFTKILGMIIKIYTTRLVGTVGIGLYMLINPTFVLLISICVLGFPTSISKLVSENKKNNKNLIFSSFFIALFLNIFLSFFILFSAEFIANNLLHDNRCVYGILSISLVLPFISISSILRGYFFGKQRMFPHVLSNIVEDIARLVSIVLFIKFFLVKGINYAVGFLVLSNAIGEVASILVLFLFLPKNFCLSKKDIKPSLDSTKSVLEISLPSTASRLIGSIGMFFEPIILTFFLIKNGYSNSFIVNEYGIINGYVMPLILLPSFFTSSISQALLPVVSKHYSINKKYVSSKIKQAIYFSLLIGIPSTLLFVLFPNIPLNLIYSTNLGTNYIRVFAPFCLLHYIQAPLTSALQGMGLSKEAMYGTFIGMVFRTIILIITSNLKIGMWGLIIASGFNIIYVTLQHFVVVKKHLKTVN